jgi:hypothetical protein
LGRERWWPWLQLLVWQQVKFSRSAQELQMLSWWRLRKDREQHVIRAADNLMVIGVKDTESVITQNSRRLLPWFPLSVSPPHP